jgi:2-methylcitrate dehydratase PrpD
MDTLTELARFATETTFDDLPEAVVHEAERTLLDALGCALASSGVAKGQMNIALSKRLGGPAESTIIGVDGKVSVTSAALANGELINAMDYSSLFGRGGHATPNLVPAILAVGESVGASGKEIITAIAVAHEIALRLSWGLSPIMTVVADGDDAQTFRWTPTYGFSRFNLGAAAGVGQLLGLDAERMAHAIGLAGHHAQLPTNAKFAHSEPPTAMTKYGTAGWQSTGAIVSGLLAEMGYIGDLTLFESEIGFWRFSGSEKWEPEKVVAGLGEEWGYPANMDYKPYPCCRLVHPSVGLFLRLIEEQQLQPEDIQSVRVIGHPYGAHPNSRNMNIATNVDAQFSIPYIFSVIAHGVPVGPRWQDEDTMQDARILGFMNRVTYEVHPDYFVPGSRAATTSLGAIEVVTSKGTFADSTDYPYGSPLPGYYFEDDALATKFRGNAERLLTAENIDRAVETVFALDTLHDVNELMRLVTPVGVAAPTLEPASVSAQAQAQVPAPIQP